MIQLAAMLGSRYLARTLPWLALAAALIAGYWWQANWHHGRGEAAGAARVQAAWDSDREAREAATAALVKAAREREDVLAAESRRQQEALREEIRIADARGRDLAQRLREYTARERERSLREAALATARPDGAGGEPGDSGEARTAVDQALEEHFAACARDAERLDGWIRWWETASQ
jgi:hypothetical protein